MRRNKLPDTCFSVLPSTGQLIIIKNGENGYYPSEWDTGSREKNREIASDHNEQRGISDIQESAMLAGSMFGWNTPGANPQWYLDNAKYVNADILQGHVKDPVMSIYYPINGLLLRYEGILSLDHTTIQVEAAGYSTSNRTVTAERTYPNLSDADVSLVPKTVNENGRTLTLADVSWQEAATDPTDGYDIPIRYTAVASYSGTATSKYATGYTVTADYKGDVTRTSCDTVIYTTIFSSTGRAEVLSQNSSFNWMWVLAPLGVLALGGCGYASYKGYKHYLNKKRGYE